MNLEKIIEKVCSIAEEVGAYIHEQRKNFEESKVESKSFNQLVSYVDKTAEQKLIEQLKDIIPAAGFITEESMIAQEKREYTWIIDPLDGTTNFIHGVPMYSVSIGLMKSNEMIGGVIYAIETKEMFYASLNNGAYLNGSRIKISNHAALNECLLATGFPYYDFRYMSGYLETLRELMKETRGMRRMGSAAIDMAYTACGRFDGFFEYGLSPWDVAAGICIVREAGGIITDFKGESDYLFGKSIMASNPEIHSTLLTLIQEKFFN